MNQDYEREAAEQGYTAVCGIDEAGRGPLAGPVCAAAVILPPDFQLDGLNDSKKLRNCMVQSLYKLFRLGLAGLVRRKSMRLTSSRQHFLPCAGLWII